MGIWGCELVSICCSKNPSFEEADSSEISSISCSMQAVHGYELAGLSFTCLFIQVEARLKERTLNVMAKDPETNDSGAFATSA